MNFDLTEDRQMLQDSLRRYLGDKYPIEHRNKVAYDEPFHDDAKWAELTELGALFALACAGSPKTTEGKVHLPTQSWGVDVDHSSFGSVDVFVGLDQVSCVDRR